MRGYRKAGFTQSVRKAGGAVFAITSEPQTYASEAEEVWGFGFPSVGDPHQEIVGELRDRGWLDLFVNNEMSFLQRSASWAAHPKGYLQPGVIAISNSGRVLYRWRGVPTRNNIGGATSRPLPEPVWRAIESALAQGEAAGDAALDVPTQVDSKAPPWPLFVALLLANGNFLRPVGFALTRGGRFDIPRRMLKAVAKLAVLIAAWVAAFVYLPAIPVAIALGLFAMAIAPGVRLVNREFQSFPSEVPSEAHSR